MDFSLPSLAHRFSSLALFLYIFLSSFSFAFSSFLFYNFFCSITFYLFFYYILLVNAFYLQSYAVEYYSFSFTNNCCLIPEISVKKRRRFHVMPTAVVLCEELLSFTLLCYYLSRNYATLGPMIRQPPCESLLRRHSSLFIFFYVKLLWINERYEDVA